MRQFPDAKGKIIARLQPCDELVLVERPDKKNAIYIEAVFLSTDAKVVKRGWIRRDSRLYIFPEPRPALPRTDTTPDVAFPWGDKNPNPGDPDYSAVTSKPFLFTCLANPHPEKARAIVSQLLDRYGTDLSGEDVEKLLPYLRYAYDADLPRVRELLQKFKDRPVVADFLAANPMFSPVVEATPAPIRTPEPNAQERAQQTIEGLSFPNLPYTKIGIGLGAVAFVAFIGAMIVRRRRKKQQQIDSQFDSGAGPSIDL